MNPTAYGVSWDHRYGNMEHGNGDYNGNDHHYYSPPAYLSLVHQQPPQYPMKEYSKQTALPISSTRAQYSAQESLSSNDLVALRDAVSILCGDPNVCEEETHLPQLST